MVFFATLTRMTPDGKEGGQLAHHGPKKAENAPFSRRRAHVITAPRYAPRSVTGVQRLGACSLLHSLADEALSEHEAGVGRETSVRNSDAADPASLAVTILRMFAFSTSLSTNSSIYWARGPRGVSCLLREVDIPRQRPRLIPQGCLEVEEGDDRGHGSVLEAWPKASPRTPRSPLEHSDLTRQVLGPSHGQILQGADLGVSDKMAGGSPLVFNLPAAFSGLLAAARK